MGLFSFSGPKQGAKVPTFELAPQPDSTDLQIRSLLYLFKRLRINKLAPFLNSDGSLRYTDVSAPVEDPSVSAKLDGLYNLLKFSQLLVSDYQRVLIDYPKNKFRAYCILSELPSANFSRPLSPVKSTRSENGSADFEDGFPVFFDAKGKRALNFAFSLLPSGRQVSIRELAASLANSLIYVEHHSYVPFSARLSAARSSIQKISTLDLTDDSVCRLTEEFKHAIVFEYLKELAFLVQLLRIYDEYMKKTSSPSIQMSETPSSLPLTSPVKRAPPALSPKKSTANLKGERTLKPRPSISNFRSNEIYSPVTSPTKKKSMKASSSTGYGDVYGREIVQDLWDKCQTSIRAKLQHEKSRIEQSGQKDI